MTLFAEKTKAYFENKYVSIEEKFPRNRISVPERSEKQCFFGPKKCKSNINIVKSGLNFLPRVIFVDEVR